MSHLGPLAKTLIGIWLVVWVGALGLYARHAVQGRVAWHVLLVSSPERPDGFPTIRGIRPAVGPFDALVAGEPRPAIGDRVLRVGDTELRGAGMLRFNVVANAETGPDLRASLLLERDGEIFETWVEAWRSPFPGVGLVGVGLGLTGLFLVIRAPRSRAARFLGTGSMAWGLAWIPFFGPGPAWQHYAWFAKDHRASAGDNYMKREANLHHARAKMTLARLYETQSALEAWFAPCLDEKGE